MIDLKNEDYVTVLIPAARIAEGTTVYKPAGEIPYELCLNAGDVGYVNVLDGRYGRKTRKVYLRHSNGNYYGYPVDKFLKVKIYKYDLQKYIDGTCEY